MGKTSENKIRKPYRAFRIIGRIITSILILLFLVLLFIRSSWGQQFIIDKATSYVSDKTHSKVALEKFYLGFDGDLLMEGLHLNDANGDTLIYSKSLEADIALWPIITGQSVGLDAIYWEGFRANIHREDTINAYNFQFLIDAFASEEELTPAPVDTSASPISIVLGKISLKDFDIDFNDKVLGIETKIVFGNTTLDIDEIDLENTSFKTDLLALKNASITFHQTPALVQTPAAKQDTKQENETPLAGILSIDAIVLDNVSLDYAAPADSLAAQVHIGYFLLEIPKIDLGTNEISIGELALQQSNIALQNSKQAQPLVETDTLQNNEIEQTFEWPTVQLALEKVNFIDNSISYQVGHAKAQKGAFNPEAIAIDKFSIDIDNIYLKDNSTGFQLNAISFKEASGIELEKFALNLALTDNSCKLENIKLAMNGAQLNANIAVDYTSLSEMMAAPDKAELELELSHYQINIEELLKLQPSLAQDENMLALSEKLVSGNLNMNGNLASLDIPQFELNWGETTRVYSKGSLENPSDPKSLQFDFETIEATSTRSDLLAFTNEDSLGIRLPETLQIKINTSGAIDDLKALVNINTSQGNASLKANYKNTNGMAYDADFHIEDYRLADLLKNEQLAPLTLSITSQGSGETIEQMNADLAFRLKHFNYNGYSIHDYAIDGKLQNGEARIETAYKDENIDFSINAFALLDSIAPQASLNIDLKGADIRALGFSNNDFRTGLKLQVNYKGAADAYDLDASIDDGIIVYNNKSYALGTFHSTAHVRKDSTALSIHNKILHLDLNSNADPAAFAAALQKDLMKHFYIENETVSTNRKPINLALNAELRFDPLLEEVFLVGMEEMETIKLAVDFNEKAAQINAAIHAPLINYGGNTIDHLVFDMSSNKDDLYFNFGFDGIDAGPLAIKRTLLSGNQKNKEMNVEFLSFHEDEKLVHLQSSITANDEGMKFHIVPDDLILNKMPWQIAATNEVIYTDDKLVFNEYKFSRDKQSVEITNKLAGQKNEHIALIYKQFNLDKLFSYLNPDTPFAEGIIDGELIVENPFANTGILADINISDFKLMDVDMGLLTLHAKSTENAGYAIDFATQNGDVNLAISGDYRADVNDEELDFKLNISQLNMTALQGFSQGELANASGMLVGDFRINGASAAPVYNGNMRFKKAQFELAKLNTRLSFEDEVIAINNEGLRFDHFTIKDKNNNTLIVAGNVGTEQPSNPTFDLSIDVNDFQLLDASEKDNDFLYGTAIFDVESKLTGDLNLPKLKLKTEINSATDITYVMPSASSSIEERDGVVSFVNRKAPESILTRSEKETATLTGIDVEASIKVVDGAKVNILIDKDTGDNFEVYGAGDLKFSMNPNGQMSLAGFYEVSGGHYEMNLYNVVDRKFELVKGSRISWAGDVLDAKLDIKTLYNVETSASALMAAQTSGADPSVKSKFRQVLPFEVYLNINGAMLQPLISFSLDMPEDEQGAIGGQVYTRIQQLNQREAELNKQVFSLLVLNSFYPDAESDGSSGGAASIARDNINDALSDQLNMFSDKLLGDTGVELDFGLNSYTDYQSQAPTERTQLDIAAQKKLFNDKLVVRVGSEVDIEGSNPNGESTPLIGNVSLEYMLTEDGRYRLKGFRRNQFDNVIDGQTIASGIGLIFTQEFNKFSELKEAILQKKKPEKEETATEKTNHSKP